jgi:anthranilate phosphoribosyltransferase
MKHAIGPRREIGIRTIFNILGPLSNPAGARHGVLGRLPSRSGATHMARAASALDVQHLFVVHGHDGLDEITTTTTSSIAIVRGSNVDLIELDPTSLGLPPGPPG